MYIARTYIILFIGAIVCTIINIILPVCGLRVYTRTPVIAVIRCLVSYLSCHRVYNIIIIIISVSRRSGFYYHYYIIVFVRRLENNM